MRDEVEKPARWAALWAEFDRVQAEGGALFPDRPAQPPFRDVGLPE